MNGDYINRVAYQIGVTNPAEVLFDTFIVEILTIVSENPKINKSLIYERLNTKSGKPATLINKMAECGLLDETRNAENRTIKHVSLTAEGERYLSMIQAMIAGKSIEPPNHGASAPVRDSVKG